MKRRNKRRLEKLSQQIQSLPIPPAVEEAAFERFRAKGELPENPRLAAAVCKRALSGEGTGPEGAQDDFAANLKRFTRLVASLEHMEPRSVTESRTVWGPLRERLFDEAVYGSEVVRLAARGALKMLVAAGREVTDPDFIDEDMPLPDFGSVGLHLLGYPECIVKAPYEDQGHRLLDRFAALRARIDREDRGWFEEFDRAAPRFLEDGELPGDELMREAVLASAEWTWLLPHYCGKGDPEVMAAFDLAARARGEAKETAILKLQAMAARGRLELADALE